MLAADIYIDTSIKGPKRRDGRYIYIIGIPEGDKYRQSKPMIREVEDTTENHLTILALAAALSHLKKPFHLDIYMDCAYVAGILDSKGYHGWMENDWLTSKGKPVTDKELWQDVAGMIKEHEVQIHLKSHHTIRDWRSWTGKGD